MRPLAKKESKHGQSIPVQTWNTIRCTMSSTTFTQDCSIRFSSGKKRVPTWNIFSSFSQRDLNRRHCWHLGDFLGCFGNKIYKVNLLFDKIFVFLLRIFNAFAKTLFSKLEKLSNIFGKMLSRWSGSHCFQRKSWRSPRLVCTIAFVAACLSYCGNDLKCTEFVTCEILDGT